MSTTKQTAATSLPRAPELSTDVSGRHTPGSAPSALAEHIGDLLGRTAHGDRVAFATLYDMLAPTVWRTARGTYDNDADAHRATEQVFLDVWRTAPILADQPGCPLSRLLKATNQVLCRL